MCLSMHYIVGTAADSGNRLLYVLLAAGDGDEEGAMRRKLSVNYCSLATDESRQRDVDCSSY